LVLFATGTMGGIKGYEVGSKSKIKYTL